MNVRQPLDLDEGWRRAPYTPTRKA